MPLNLVSQKDLNPTRDSTAPLASDGFRDLWDAECKTRTIIDASGTRTTFTYGVESRTVIQYPTGCWVTLTWDRSQMTTDAATLSQFASHVEFRSQPAVTSTTTQVGAFLAHPESQFQLTAVANGALRTPSKRRRWLTDVLQQANLQLLSDLRRRKLIFDGDDPERFVCWFRGAIRHAVVDAIKFCLRALAGSALGAAIGKLTRRHSADPSEIVMLRELGRLAEEGIERVGEAETREVMRDLRDGKSARDSARRLGVSKSVVGRLRKSGCRIIARSLGR